MNNLIKIQYLAIFMIMTVNSFCQVSVDNIKSDKDAVEFVKSYSEKYNMQWKDVGVDVYSVFSERYFSKDDRGFVDSIITNKWVRSDFNGDGKADLVFFGRVDHQLAVLSFVSQKDGSIQCKNLGSIRSDLYPTRIAAYELGKLNLLLIKSFVSEGVKYDIRNSYKEDTLTYKFGNFIDFNVKEGKPFDFDSISYGTYSNWVGIIEVPLMTVVADGTLKLYRDRYTGVGDSTLWINGKHISRIGNEKIENLKAILGYINFSSLDSDYSIKNVFDMGTTVTTVYHKGKMKKISDYGSQGKYGLKLLYEKLYEIKIQNLPKRGYE